MTFNTSMFDLLAPLRHDINMQTLHYMLSEVGRKEPQNYNLFKHMYRMAPKAKCKLVEGKEVS